jgi:polar amino acid transport system substrate-binding protein
LEQAFAVQAGNPQDLQGYEDAARDRSIYYGACGFRFQDADLLAAFNRHLLEFRGTPEHLALVANFGVTRDTLRNRTTAEICGR